MTSNEQMIKSAMPGRDAHEQDSRRRPLIVSEADGSAKTGPAQSVIDTIIEHARKSPACFVNPLQALQKPVLLHDERTRATNVLRTLGLNEVSIGHAVEYAPLVDDRVDVPFLEAGVLPHIRTREQLIGYAVARAFALLDIVASLPLSMCCEGDVVRDLRDALDEALITDGLAKRVEEIFEDDTDKRRELDSAELDHRRSVNEFLEKQ